MAQVVPFTTDPSQRFEITLNNVRLFFTAKYSYNGNKWTLDIESSPLGILFCGLTMLLGKNIIGFDRDATAAIGQLWMIDLTAENLDATRESLGVSVVMIHYPPGEEPNIPPIEIVKNQGVID